MSTPVDPAVRPRPSSRRLAVMAIDDACWYSTEAFAGLLGITRQTLLNKRSDGEGLPTPARIGNRHYYRGADIRAWLQEQVGR